MVTRDTPWPAGTPCWVDLGVSDVPKAIAFYSAQFGWDIQVGPPEAGGYAIAHLEGKTAAGIGPKMSAPDAPNAWTTYLASEDVDATAARIKSAGGQLLMDPMDVMDVGRMAVGMDTTGAVFGIWQARAHTGVGIANVPGALTWNEQMSRDFEGAKAFYAAVFGYEFGDMSGDGFSYATLLLEGREVGGIGGYPPEVPSEIPASWTSYFAAADTDAAVATAVKNGGSVVRQPEDSPYGRMGTVADSQGAVFALISMPPGQ